MGPSHVEDPEQLKYLNILFDFAYLKNPEDFENMINSNTVGSARRADLRRMATALTWL